MSVVELSERLREELTTRECAEDFLIDSLEKAIWAMRKIAAAKAKIKEIDAVGEAEIQRVKTWVDKEKASHIRTIDSMEYLLRPYVASATAESKKKSVNLPNGTTGFRKASVKYSFNEAEFNPWAKENGWVTPVITEKIEWDKLKKSCKIDGSKLVTEDGEVIPGVCIEHVPDTFYVSVGEGNNDGISDSQGATEES